MQGIHFRIENLANGLVLDVNHSGDISNMKEGSATPLFIQPFTGNWGQVWEIHNGQIRNAQSGFNLHHGNQSADEPFACMVRPTSEAHQIWTFNSNGTIISALDGKGLTVSGNDKGSRVDLRPFNVSSPPTDCQWALVPIPAQYRIQNRANGLVLDVNHSGDISNMQEGSATPLFIQSFTGNWGQVWELHNGQIRNAQSGFNLHHGNQSADEPFACMVRPTSEKHQVWYFNANGTIISALDGKGLTVSGNDKGSRVDVRPFDVNSPPTDCQWTFVRL